MGCLFLLIAAASPRLALLFLWLFTPYVARAFGSFILPFLGFLFLPITTIVYALVYVPGVGVTGFAWLLVIWAFVADLLAAIGTAYTNRERVPGYGSTPPDDWSGH
jgi:hypothetical protein